MAKISNEKIVRRIKSIRTKNNSCWMKLLLVAVQSNPKKAKKIFQQIVEHDRQVSKWMSRLH